MIRTDYVFTDYEVTLPQLLGALGLHVVPPDEASIAIRPPMRLGDVPTLVVTVRRATREREL